LINIDPDVAYFRSRHNQMTQEQKNMLQDLVQITTFKATSDLPQWLKPIERKRLLAFLEEQPGIEQLERYRFKINNRTVDFSPIIPLPKHVKFPAQLALFIGAAQMGLHELLPGIKESLQAEIKSKI
jgi:hypothetical protein